MGRTRDYWHRRHAGYRKRGVSPPDIEDTRRQEVRRWRQKEIHVEAGEAPGKTTFRRTLIYPPGQTSVTIMNTTPRGPYMARPERMVVTVELENIMRDEEGVAWRWGDWSNFRFMSRLCPTRSEAPTKTDIENQSGDRMEQSGT